VIFFAAIEHRFIWLSCEHRVLFRGVDYHYRHFNIGLGLES